MDSIRTVHLLRKTQLADILTLFLLQIREKWGWHTLDTPLPPRELAYMLGNRHFSGEDPWQRGGLLPCGNANRLRG